MHNINIANCNSIDSASIRIDENILNIKFGANGTGKSTIANAIYFAVSEDKDLTELMPFKLRQNNPEDKAPSVDGIDALSSVKFFNEDYVSQFVFKPDELVDNSFDIFIQTDSYKEKTQEIETIVSEIKQVFSTDETLNDFLLDLKTLASSFKLTQTGISRASPAIKGLASGNILEHIPNGLEGYTPFLQNSQNVSWIDWQIKGKPFLDISDDCPFCTSQTTDIKDQILRVSEEYDKNTIKHLSGLINSLEKLGGYFSPDCKARLDTITALRDGLQDEHINFLVEIKKQLDNLIGKLEDLKNLSAIHFGKDEQVAEKLPLFRIDLTFFDNLDSDKTNEQIALLNTSLDHVIERAGQLQGQINQQRQEAARLIEKYQKEINQFLSNAGYDYLVSIEGNDDDYRLKLKHKDFDGSIAGGNQHLSFGERNAFALVLFMYECLSKNPDLIILDDPISSFDKNKKYAIMDMLFRQDQCMKTKTVLLLTHDVEPVIDTVKVMWKQFNNLTGASFLKSSNGILSETEIKKDDILSFSQICNRMLISNKESIVKLVYLRRLYEILDDKGDAYEVLSNLFHKRHINEATDSRHINDEGEVEAMSRTVIEDGINEIRDKLEGFDYDQEITKIRDDSQIVNCYHNCDNTYEKLQFFRILHTSHDNSVIRKFINESYHIENELICQLDPCKFDTVPQYVIDECDKFLAELAAT